MTPDAIDQAIAEFIGWTDIESYSESYRLWGNRPGSEGESYRLNAVPRFHKCLNAMAEARKGLNEKQQAEFIDTLNTNHNTSDIYYPDKGEQGFRKQLSLDVFGLVDTTATQQATALLRTIGKYQEPSKLSTHCAV